MQLIHMEIIESGRPDNFSSNSVGSHFFLRYGLVSGLFIVSEIKARLLVSFTNLKIADISYLSNKNDSFTKKLDENGFELG